MLRWVRVRSRTIIWWQSSILPTHPVILVIIFPIYRWGNSLRISGLRLHGKLRGRAEIQTQVSVLLKSFYWSIIYREKCANVISEQLDEFSHMWTHLCSLHPCQETTLQHCEILLVFAHARTRTPFPQDTLGSFCCLTRTYGIMTKSWGQLPALLLLAILGNLTSEFHL